VAFYHPLLIIIAILISFFKTNTLLIGRVTIKTRQLGGIGILQ